MPNNFLSTIPGHKQAYRAEYVMQDFRQPMGVATYKTSDEMDAKLLEVLPSKEQLEKLLGD